MSRPVGARIVAICEVLDLYGAMAAREVFDAMEGVELANVHKYCHRAVGLRLVSINRNAYPATFKTIPGWKEKLGRPYIPPPAKRAKSSIPRGVRIASVWALGAVA